MLSEPPSRIASRPADRSASDSDRCSVAYGPLIFALDQPPENASLDGVALDLGRGDIRDRLTVSFEAGWPVVRVPARLIPARATFDPSYQPIGGVDLLPVLFAGLLAHWGQKGPAEIEPKRAWTFRHIQWLAQQHGIALEADVCLITLRNS